MSTGESNEHMEKWLPIPGWEGCYEASDLGRIRSIDRQIRAKNGAVQRYRGRVLRPGRIQDGHLIVELCHEGVRRTRKVHRLVLTAFSGPAPEGAECCHDDGDPTNNRITNLYWGTRSQNIQDRFRHGWIPPKPSEQRRSTSNAA